MSPTARLLLLFVWFSILILANIYTYLLVVQIFVFGDASNVPHF